jgi:hypothetical protein
MSLSVTPRCLLVCLTSDSASGAVANQRPGDTTWLMKQSGGDKLRAKSGWRPRSLERRRTRDTPVAVSPTSRGSFRISPTLITCGRFQQASLGPCGSPGFRCSASRRPHRFVVSHRTPSTATPRVHPLQPVRRAHAPVRPHRLRALAGADGRSAQLAEDKRPVG